MPLVVGTNTSAQFAQDALRANQRKSATAMERLSTGLRINSAKDDAAGLAISQSMTSQIRGLNQAVRNINDGINLLQTAEGGLSSITDMLQRMRELAVQSVNGTNSDAQRAYLQKEAAALQEQISKVVDTTTWNDKKLLDGSFTAQKIQVGANAGTVMEIAIAATPTGGGSSTTSYLATAVGSTLGAVPLASGDLLVNGTPIGASASASADSLASAINAQAGLTGVTATARATNANSTAITVPVAPSPTTPGAVSVSVAPVAVSESGSTNLTYTFTRAGDTSNALTIDLSLGGSSIATDYVGNISFASPAQPAKEWTKLLGTSYWDDATAVAVGLDGGIYIAGTTMGNLNGQGANNNKDAYLSKFNPNGTIAWTQLLNNGGEALALKTGLDGAVYVSGTTEGSPDGQSNNGHYDAFLTKFSPDGNKAWTRLLGSPSGDAARALTTGLDGSIYVSGYTQGSLDGQTNNNQNGTTDAFLTKYGADGAISWTRLLGTSGEDLAFAVTNGLDGSVYVSGYTLGSLDGQSNSGNADAFLTKYGADGTKLWTKLFGGSQDQLAHALTTGLDGSIYVSGYTVGGFDGQNASGGQDAYLTKYSPDGTKVWTKIIGTSGSEEVRGIATGLDGSIYLTGFTNGNLASQTNNGNQDAFISKFNVDGTQIWTKLVGTSADDFGFSIATGANGSMYISGFTMGALDGQTNLGSSDAFLTKFSVGGPQVTFAAGSSTATLVLDPVADSLTEGSETLSVTVLAGTGYSVDTATATGTIVEGVANQFDAIANGDIQINGVNIGAIAAASSNSERQAQVRTAINAQTANTGVAATLDSNTGGVNLTAADGRNIEVSTLTSAAIPNRVIGIALNGSPLGTRTVTTIRSGIDLSTNNPSGITITASGGAAAATGLSSQTISSTVTTTTIPAIDISTAAGASSAIGVIDSTLDSVNSTRSTIGSYINRLSYAADNVANISTNLSASRSAIMDTDYAEESANLAKSQIVQQAATAMLAQANQQPQSVLALLKNL